MPGGAFCEWGPVGAETLRYGVAVIVVVDVLSFSTAVDVAVGRGASVIPFPWGDQDAARAAADAAGALLAGPRRLGSDEPSLSPGSLAGLACSTTLLLPSPNGSRISLAGGGTRVMAGCLRNAAAVAAWAARLADGRDIAVIPAGERWPDGSLRPAIEDLLGAGAILDALGLPLSPEAAVARDAFRSAGGRLAELIRDSVSGRELIERGFPEDVALALEVDASPVAPALLDGAYRAAGAQPSAETSS